MATYTEFNRDLFLCNTLQKDTDVSFPSLIFENNSGNSVLTYNNLQNASFFFIPKTAAININMDSKMWSSLSSLKEKINNANEFITYLKTNSDHIKSIQIKKTPPTNSKNFVPYQISNTLYADLKNNMVKYSVFLKDLSKYSTTDYIHVYTFGKIEHINVENDQTKGGLIQTTKVENFQSRYSTIEGFKNNKINLRKSILDRINKAKKITARKKIVNKQQPQKQPQNKQITNVAKAQPTPIVEQPKTILQKLSGGRAKLIPPAPTPVQAAQMNKVAINTANNINKQISGKLNAWWSNFNRMRNIFPIRNMNELLKIKSRLLSNRKEPFTDYLINTGDAAKQAIDESTTTMYYEYSSKDIYQLTDKIYDVIDISCANYPINAICTTDNNIERAKCEVCKNFAYRDWYDANNANNIRHFANHDDSKHEYSRTWIQTCNLGIGILLLSFGIYYQQSN